ncbi:MAG: DUF6600 domain-containing protein [Sulfuricaulis sp.]
MPSLRRLTTRLFVLLLMLGSVAVLADEYEPASGPTPPRLSFVDGAVSYWRPGAEDWVAARLNTPLASGDALYAAEGANLELQIGSRAFVRMTGKTQVTLVSHEPDYDQFKVTTGVASFDLRMLPPGYSVELDTPNAVFTIEHTGYYRVEVDDDTHFISRRGGRATVTTVAGEAQNILPAEEIVVHGGAATTVEADVAPEFDSWDRWNYARTDYLIEAVSARYLPAGVYGAEELDHYGDWREVSHYGPVWVPDQVPAGWAPYSEGSWVWDPYYKWTWVDDAPWGWAPSHYGRWVFINGFWAWAPGPVVVRPVYAPALVAFFGVGRPVSVGISTGVGWVALGWGEPVFPWWGRPEFVGQPSWRGWGGPRVVNNVVIQQTTVVNVTHITFQNTQVHNAVVVISGEQFGRERVHAMPAVATQVHDLVPVRGSIPVQPMPVSLIAGASRGVRPSETLLSRPVLSTRPYHESKLPWRTETAQRGIVIPEVHLVPPSQRPQAVLVRPKFGAENGSERPRPSLPPRFEEVGRTAALPTPPDEGQQRAERMPSRAGSSIAVAPPHVPSVSGMPPRQSQVFRGEKASPPVSRALSQEARSHEKPARESRALPGKPANRLFRRHERDETQKGANENQR